MVATDLDGTIVRSDGTISARTKQALEAVVAAGSVVVLVTGRPMRWLDGIAVATGHRGVAICANGALVVDLATDEVVTSRTIDPRAMRHVVDRLRAEIPDVGFAVEHVAGTFAHEPTYRPRWDRGDGEGPRRLSLDELIAGDAVKLLARHDTLGPDELLARACAAVDPMVASLTHSSSDGLLEISAPGVTKATALATYCESLGVDAARVLAFGDMPNDIPMLAWAGHGVAVANAHSEVLATADERTSSNDDDGVARVIEREFSPATAGL